MVRSRSVPVHWICSAEKSITLVFVTWGHFISFPDWSPRTIPLNPNGLSKRRHCRCAHKSNSGVNLKKKKHYLERRKTICFRTRIQRKQAGCTFSCGDTSFWNKIYDCMKSCSLWPIDPINHHVTISTVSRNLLTT